MEKAACVTISTKAANLCLLLYAKAYIINLLGNTLNWVSISNTIIIMTQ